MADCTGSGAGGDAGAGAARSGFVRTDICAGACTGGWAGPDGTACSACVADPFGACPVRWSSARYACRICTTAVASPSALCAFLFLMRRARQQSSSFRLLSCGRYRWLASNVQYAEQRGNGMDARANSARRNASSNSAWWATTTRPFSNDPIACATWANSGACATSRSVMPWTCVAPTGCSGLIRVDQESTCAPVSSVRMIAISTIRWVCGWRPVVSTSMTENCG